MRRHPTSADAWTCVLLRHAHAGDPAAWRGPDESRPLSRLGWSQAADVVGALGMLGLRRLLSSPSLRCTQTLAPLSDVLSLNVEPVAQLSVNCDRDLVVALLSSPESDGLIACTHGEVIEDVLDRWPGLDDGARAPTAKGGCWIISGVDGAARELRYFPPRTSERIADATV